MNSVSRPGDWLIHFGSKPAVGNSPPNVGRIFGPRAWATLSSFRCGSLLSVPEIPESRFIVFAFKRRFVPACASLNRGFQGLIRTFRRIRQMFEPRNVVLNIVEFSEMSEWLGQRYPHLDATSRALLFRKLVPLGNQSLVRRYVV